MRIQAQNIFLLIYLFFSVVSCACASETVLDIPKKEALARLKKGDLSFIFEALPSRMPELSKIDAAAPFYAALLIEQQDDERAALLFQEALQSPEARDAALRKLSAHKTVSTDTTDDASGASAGSIAAGQIAAGRKDYNEALRKFQLALDEKSENFLLDKELLGDLGKTFQYASIPQKGAPARTGAALFLDWEKEMREGKRLWSLPEPERRGRRYLLLYYAARMKRQLAEYDEAQILFTKALSLAPDSEQSDACIWYILDTSFIRNGGKTGQTKEIIKEYAPLMSDKSYFLDFFEKYTHFLCRNSRWNDIAELFPYIRRFGAAELRAKYAFILGNIVELKFLTPEKAAAALDLPFLDTSARASGSAAAPPMPNPDDFYQIAYNSESIAGADSSSFYYAAAAAEKLGKTPRFNIPRTGNQVPDKPEAGPAKNSGNGVTKKFLNGFFLFGAERFAYPYILENMEALSIEELRSFAKMLAETERWGDSIRLVRTYMQRPDYDPSVADTKLCYPFAFNDIVKDISRETGMDESLLFGLIRTESLFIPDIVSRAGAVGLTQLMPETAGDMARQLVRRGGPDYFTDGVLDLSYPVLNVHLGALYFQQLKTRMDGTLLALLSYNGGMNRVRRWRNERPMLNDALFLESVEYTETREYGRQVLTAAAIYGYLAK
ncbi:MAG: lytic transglycosylase domain-containing protein [Spirochaetaceae bacterium]|jgi:soluble lytic murein transglycosylase|nr:lytic transglycosylase domain-containing protein [Spirochaetaceae bacterium]